LDWSKLPDLAAVTLLAIAFSAVARRSQASVSVLWLTGWALIALHFAAFIFAPGAEESGTIAAFIGFTALAWAGILFMWAFVPYRNSLSSFSMAAILLGTNSLYIAVILAEPVRPWALILAAALFGILPLTLALATLRTNNHPLRWMLVALYCALSAFLLVFQNRPGNGLPIALNATLFTVYFGCSLHFIYSYRQRTTGAFITMAGFLGWAAVFVVAPSMGVILPRLQLESEVWNLPKYVVAVGMILVLLEEQIEHNKYLALHDELTGLPNRRLFQDRLGNALERARRTGSQAALLLIDLDQFKQVNDTLGHHAGDQVLKHVGKVFGDRIRRSDTVARTGGDEFSLILDDPTSREDAERVGASLIELLDAPFELGDQVVRIGASVGIAVFPEDALDAEGLCIAADLRMYDFKHKSGRHEHLARPPKSVVLPVAEEPAQSQQAG
jgi:diguanylate cyclase (GGDEF)-like protein